MLLHAATRATLANKELLAYNNNNYYYYSAYKMRATIVRASHEVQNTKRYVKIKNKCK